MTRIATYNVEWFAQLFDRKNALINDNSWSGRYDVTRAQQIAALGTVFQALDADAIMIIEAPNSGSEQSTVTALENFAQHFGLRQNRVLVGFENGTQQEIALMYDPDLMQVYHDPQGQPPEGEDTGLSPRFDGEFRLDVDVDSAPETITFSKPPLEVALFPTGSDPIRLIGVHAKSKAPHGARNKQQEVRISIANRRKQLAQCIWVRQRVDRHLSEGDDLIVLGDFNDGPGLDEYEKLFGHSGIEIVLGVNKSSPDILHDPNAKAAMEQRRSAVPTTARFYNHKTKTYLNALLDYVMVSDQLFRSGAPKWKIWHPFDDPVCFKTKGLCEALLAASDHFPVSVDLDLPAGAEK
ncbi:MAG: endonuclease [Rhodobacteraceae bacterium]|nr:endonuclease [Paracoccaceae bacterium]